MEQTQFARAAGESRREADCLRAPTTSSLQSFLTKLFWNVLVCLAPFTSSFEVSLAWGRIWRKLRRRVGLGITWGGGERGHARDAGKIQWGVSLVQDASATKRKLIRGRERGVGGEFTKTPLYNIEGYGTANGGWERGEWQRINCSFKKMLCN